MIVPNSAWAIDLRMIGIVIHGAEPLDSGTFQEIASHLDGVGRIIMAGTTGAIAAIDAGLEGSVEMLGHKLVSSAVKELSDEHDLILIINQGKTLEGSLRFASVVRHRSCPIDSAVVMLDDGFHSVLSPGSESIWMPIAEMFCPERKEVPDYRDTEARVLHGVIPGESIWVNGNVIGVALSENPRIWRNPEGGLEFEGIEIRESALAHAGDFDHQAAKIRSGKVRRTRSTPVSLPRKGGSRAILIDHQAERALDDCEDVCIAVTVGDDTTCIAAGLLYRFSIPVVGIVDGDVDGICDEELTFPGSVIIEVEPGKDDLVGGKVKELLFSGGSALEGADPDEIIKMVRYIASCHTVNEKRC